MTDTEKEIPVVTTPRVDNYAHETIGLIHAGAHTQLLEYSLESAINSLRVKAKHLGANAVVGMRHSVSHSREHNGVPSYIVAVTGTAVKLPWPFGNANPELLAENPDNLPTE